MHRAENIREHLLALGIRPTDTVLIHSSLKAIGEVEGGPDALLDVLSEVLSEGLILFPTHTWQTWNNPNNIYDPQNEPSCVGFLGERFRHRAGVVRSWHPTHSIAGLGSSAATFLAAEENTRSPCPRRGCWGRLYDVGAQILFLGAPLRANTFIHSVEEWHDVPDRLASERTVFKIRTPSGGLLECSQHRHHTSFGDVSQNYGKIEPDLLRLGIAREGPVGSARSVICDARATADYVSGLLESNIDYFSRL